MNTDSRDVVYASMQAKQRCEWKGSTVHRRKKTDTKRLLKNVAFSAAAVLCVGGAAAGIWGKTHAAATSVMSHVTASFDYDETLGRLQFVSSILPQSAMVFLQGSDDALTVCAPSDAQIVHVWTEEEPWLEYACQGDVLACDDGEVMTIVKNRADAYTVRLLHGDGVESIYSGLTELSLDENDVVSAGQRIGRAEGTAAFELRKEGLSILPVFAAQ